MNQKNWGILALMAVMALPAGAARADDGDSRTQLFGTVDYYLRGDIDEEVEEDYNAAVDASLTTASNEITTSNGVGARLGLRRVIDDRFDFGASASYVVGPEIEATFETPAGRSVQTIETTFIRLMVEGAGRIPLSNSVYLRLGGGVGMGKAEVEDRTDAGLLTSSGDADDTGFTWEVSPAIVFKAGRTDIEVGARYAQFPKIDGTDETYEIDWSPFGVYVGAAF